MSGRAFNNTNDIVNPQSLGLQDSGLPSALTFREFLQPAFREDQRDPTYQGRELAKLHGGAILPCSHW